MSETAAKPNNVDAFITGLKMVIRNSWPTQEEFAKGVTSKVNMSNILRGTGGTSYKMRKALAARAGVTVEDVVALGQKKATGRNHFSSVGNPELISTPARRATDTAVSDVSFPFREEGGYGD